MKAEQRTVFIARDGRDFPTKALCLAHERKTCGGFLVGLSAKQVEAARTGADHELADTFRMFVNEMRNTKRRRPDVAEATNNGGDKSAPPLSDDAGNGRAADSMNRTDAEQAGAP
jgi:hypothetical protein